MSEVEDDSAGRKPRFRAGLTKSALDAIRRLAAEQSDAILERIGDDALDVVTRSSRTDWLDVEVMLQIDHAVYEVLGPGGFAEFWERFASASTTIPVLRPIADGALRLFASPPSMFKLLPRGYVLIARDLGEIAIVVDEPGQRVDVVLSEVPKLSRPRLYGEACRASFAGMLALLGKTGAVVVDLREADDGCYRFSVTWE